MADPDEDIQINKTNSPTYEKRKIMKIPDYQSLMLPLLKHLDDGQEKHIHACAIAVGEHFKMTKEEVELRIPSGQTTYIRNRTGWARTYMKKAKLVSSPKRGFVQITQLGLDTLKEGPAEINNKYLIKFPGFVEFRERKTKNMEVDSVQQLPVTTSTPDVDLENIYHLLKQELKDDLLEQIQSCTPYFFEKLVLDLIVSMGYGGSREDANESVKTRDGGIDGMIKEDPLGLDNIYLQAKKWDAKNTVGRPEIQKFAGALQGQQAKKGIFITTSSFTKDAHDYVKTIEVKIILIDGDLLTNLMFDSGVGVSVVETYILKKVKSDYFVESDYYDGKDDNIEKSAQ